MNGDLFDNVPEAAPVKPAKRERLRKGSKVVCISTGPQSDPNGLEVGDRMTVQTVHDGKPDLDAVETMWREDGSHWYTCEIDDQPGALVMVWPEEIERA